MLTNEVAIASLGQYGKRIISDTTERTPPTGYHFFCIKIMVDAKFETLTVKTGYTATKYESASVKQADANAANCISYPAGIDIIGQYTAIKLHSGAVEAFYKPNA